VHPTDPRILRCFCTPPKTTSTLPHNCPQFPTGPQAHRPTGPIAQAVCLVVHPTDPTILRCFCTPPKTTSTLPHNCPQAHRPTGPTAQAVCLVVHPTDPTILRCFCPLSETNALLPHNCPQAQVHELSAWLCIPQLQPPYVVFVHFQSLPPFSPTTAHRLKCMSFLLGCVSHRSNHPTLFLYISRAFRPSPPQLPTGSSA